MDPLGLSCDTADKALNDDCGESEEEIVCDGTNDDTCNVIVIAGDRKEKPTYFDHEAFVRGEKQNFERARPEFCRSMLYNYGWVAGEIGNATSIAGLGSAAMATATLDPPLAAASLEVAAVGGIASTVGDMAQAFAGSPQATIRTQLSVMTLGASSIFIPKSLKNKTFDVLASMTSSEIGNVMSGEEC